MSGAHKYRLDVPRLRPSWLLGSTGVFIGQKLGEGAFGIVSKGVLTEVAERIPVAIKELNEAMLEEDVNNLWREARIMRSLRNPNIVNFYGIINDFKV